MPRLTDNTGLDQLQTATGSYGFSATKLDDLGASEYTLVTICCDESGSVEPFKKELEAALKEAVSACKHSPRADNLMIRTVAFSQGVREVHGFKLLSTINADDYNGCLHLGGMTSLYDAANNGIEATVSYGKDLSKNDYNVNALVIVLTDGMDNMSTSTDNMVHTALKTAVTSEHLESIVSILVGVNTNEQSGQVKQFLSNFNNVAGFSQFIEIENATAKALAKLADFISKSISAQSQALGTGGPSKSLSF